MIYAMRTITVKDGSSMIDEPVVLYRGDKEIELVFGVLQQSFKFGKSENLIKTSKASHGQLIIEKLDGNFIFSNISECENGKIKFVMTEFMIDELSEVGIYDIQIRLYDDTIHSRISIPPIKNAIEVREPLTVANPAVADQGVVNLSIIDKAGEEEEIFDEEGSYIKTEWSPGDTITSAKLNKIEFSLETINNNDIQKGIDTNAKLDEITERLDTGDVNIDLSDYAKTADIPTKTSELTNDSNFLTYIPSAYVTEYELNAKGYLTEHQDLSDYAKTVDIPTKTSELTNDSNFLSSVPSEYVTDSELNAKGYLTEHQDLSDYAKTVDIPTKTSELTNDSNFLSSVPSEYVTDSELNAKGYLTEHQDISNKVDKVSGKGLSTNDYTTAEKNKLAGIESGANKVTVYKAKECTTFTSDDGTCTPLAVQKAVKTFPPKEHEHSQYLTEHQDLSDYAKTVDIPTKTSELTNDSGYIANKSFITPQMFGAKADGVTDDSQAILDAIAALPKDGGTLYFPAGTYIHGDGITTGLSYQIDTSVSTDTFLRPLLVNKGVDDRIGRDIRLIFNGYKNLKIIGDGAILQSHENNGECSNNKFFTFIRCENVLIENITIDGKREERDIKLNDYSPGGFDVMRSNLDFLRCKRIIVRNVISKNSMMDGMALAAGSETEYNEDVLIEQCVFNNNHRQGISIEGVKNIVVKDTECSYNGTGKGILPKSGIDVEAYGYVGPGEQYSYNVNVLIDNCYFDSNGGSSVISNQNSFNVTFQNCVMKNADVNATPVADAQVLYCRLENCSIANSFNRIAYNIFTYNKGGYVIQSLAVSGTSTAIIEHNTFDMTPTSETFKSYKYNSMRLEEDETFRYNHVINACAVSGGGYYPIFLGCKNFIGNILELTDTSFEGTNIAPNPYVNNQKSKGGKAKDNICIGYTLESASNINIDEFTTSLKTNYDKAYTHSNSAHAPSNAQKNSDITKAEIEAKLTGEISSHSHSRTDENWGAENVGMVLMVGSDGRLVLYDLADYNPNAQFYNVIQNYTNVSSDYSKTQAKESFPLTITLVTTNGKKLDDVKVIMGGEDVTSRVYSDGKIVITSVTGEIVITADAMLYTNLFDHTHPDVITGQRWNKVGAILNNRPYGIVTHDIPYTKGCTVRIKGLGQMSTDIGSGVGGTVIMEIKDETGARKYLQCLDTINGNGFFKSGTYIVDNANNSATFTFTDTRNGFIKISGDRVGTIEEVIITVNEEIID